MRTKSDVSHRPGGGRPGSRGRRRARAAVTLLAGTLLFPWIGVDGAAAHEDAVLESNRSTIEAGTMLPVTGVDFTEGETYRLQLLGALNEYDLRNVKAGDDGEFQLDVAIPATVRAGVYQLVAVASDGDVVARLDLTVVEGAPADVDRAEHELAEQGGAAHENGGASADELEINRNRSGLEWGAIGLLVGVAGVTGLGLLRS